MLAIASLLVVVTASLIITRVAAAALQLTGLSRSAARFHARSAYTGVGFTTSEAEQVVNHPVRRRIIMGLMFIGHVGFVTILSSVVLSFISMEAQLNSWLGWLVLAVGLAFLMLVARSDWVDRRLHDIISWALNRWTDLDVRDYANLLHLSSGYGVTEVVITEEGMDGRSLEESGFLDAGILMLGILTPRGEFTGAPERSARIHAGDTLFLYGPTRNINDFCQAYASRGELG
jgi:MFS family permease